jgi:haloacetate dehalogenase
MASAILEVATQLYQPGVNVILAGHDRGARAMHRAAVDIDQLPVQALGLWMADVVPIVEEYASFSHPDHSTNYWHWVRSQAHLNYPLILIAAELPAKERFCN